jgi:hypothetical protein
MTRNQEHVRLLPMAIASDEIDATELQDQDWALLLLAADIYRVHINPRIVACRVLQNIRRESGYFAPRLIPSIDDDLLN